VALASRAIVGLGTGWSTSERQVPEATALDPDEEPVDLKSETKDAKCGPTLVLFSGEAGGALVVDRSVIQS
jgi:hypothetical protein